MEKTRVIGHIADVIPGSIFRRRKHVLAAKLHGDNRRGISTLKDSDGSIVADAIVLNGGYDDDEDGWEWIRYTGAGGQDDHNNQVADQSWEYRDNAALKLSFERKHPIRIIRGYNGDARYSVPDNYRYDGLYEIIAVRMARSKAKRPNGEPFKICQFDMQRLSVSGQELTALERDAAGLFDLDYVERFPKTRTTTIQRLVRDSAVVRRVKSIHNHECQICGIIIVGGDGRRYSEGAHIKPLGRQHGGPDVDSNVLCICPNCHVRLDNGSIYITDDWLVVDRAKEGEGVSQFSEITRRKGHRLQVEYVAYHRSWWNERLAGGGK